jgi:ribonuclease HI
MAKEKSIIVHTDGACSNNPGGPGGWAATLSYDDRFDVISGYSLCTTNNRMELTAVVESIKYLKKKGYKKIIINSDSAYVINGVNKGWIHEWVKKGWKTKQGSDLANSDLWKELYEFYTDKGLTILFNKVAGHSGHTFNEIADEEAKKEVEHAKRILSVSNNPFSE